MKLQTGIIGLPNVGKSTLFNALVGDTTAQAANFPFCTIEPNVGVVAVPDPRLSVLEKINESESVVPAVLEFVDIAGLVEGASTGEGLGNQFLANIRECDAIIHVVRCFDDEHVIHVSGSVDPVRDAEIINIELMLADYSQAEKRLTRITTRGNKREHSTPEEKDALKKIIAALDKGESPRSAGLTEEEKLSVKNLGLLSMKPIIYAANVADFDLAKGNDQVRKVEELAKKQGARVVTVSAQVESELVALSDDERLEFLDSLGVDEENSGLRNLIRAAYDLLDLQTYFTSGPKETRAWTIPRGTKAPQAAGVIHSDFERGFIRAEAISYKDLLECGSEKAAKEKGLLRSEGKDYVVQEGDVLLFRFNV